MTLNEFKYWLEGYAESFKDGVPNKEQYAKIMQQLDNVTSGIIPSFPTYPNTPNYPGPITPSYPGVAPWTTDPYITC